MMKLCYAIPLLCCMTVCHADEPVLQNGAWLGAIKLPGKDKVAARFQISKSENATKITMYVEDTPLEFINLQIRKSTLSFNIDTGIIKRCILKIQEGGAYTGTCLADDENTNEAITLTMSPPSSKPPASPDNTDEDTAQ